MGVEGEGVKDAGFDGKESVLEIEIVGFRHVVRLGNISGRVSGERK